MNIIQIIPGSGGSFYCGNCLRDSKFYDAMKELGHDVIKIPMYLPLFADEHDLNDVPVFYGAISMYLKQQYRIFRNMPRWMERMFNSKPMLKLAARQAGSTRATGLEDMTVSMLLGEQGKQKKELEEMVDWIARHGNADVIHISNALLLGLAKQLKEKTGAKIICSLQDEDVWVDVMEDPFRNKVWKLMGEKAHDVDHFIAVSDYYAGVSIDRMGLPKEKVTTIHLGVDPEEYTYRNSAEKPRTIGYISRTCHENGLDILVDAFHILKKDAGFEDVKLLITGGHTGDDKKYLREIRKSISENGFENDVAFRERFDGEDRMQFFNEVAVMSVPVRNGEAFGIYITEAMASGIPVVQPEVGAYPEIINKGEGGIIFGENNPEKLAEALKKLLSDKELLQEQSEKARKSAMENFNIFSLGKTLTGVYESL